MVLSRLSLRHFRNLGKQDLEVPPEGFALIGDNAQGKSNLFEAVYYLETFRSFRGARDPDLVEFGERFFRVEASLSDPPRDDRLRVAAAYEKGSARKKVTVAGKEVERIADGLGHLAAVVFSPADVSLVSGGPAERRRFLDIVLSLNAPGYVDHLQRYRQALDHRNAALREAFRSEEVAPWDGPLVRHGAQVLYRRARWVAEYARAFADTYAEVSGGPEAWIEYRSSFDLGGADASGPEGEGGEGSALERVRGAFVAALAATRERERRHGWTVVGPHRDDLFLGLGDSEGGGLELRRFGSGGQRRTAALALRLTEAETVRRTRERRPLVLMDDVFAELDEGRSERLLRLLDGPGTGQVLLTAPKEADVRLRRDTLPRWRIRGGTVAP